MAYRDSFHARSRALQILHKTPDIFILGISEAEEPVYACRGEKRMPFSASARSLAFTPARTATPLFAVAYLEQCCVTIHITAL